MRKILSIVLASALAFSFSVQVLAGNSKNSKKKPKSTITCKTKTYHPTTVPSHGGRENMAQGIEGHRINWGFDLGGSLALMNALNREKAFIGGKGALFIHGILPNTRTFAMGFEGGFTYLLANEQKFKETLTAFTRDGSLATEKQAQVKVGNWMLPTAQLSFMGNFHPIQRFNIQIKGNVGIVAAMIPKYEAEYYVKDIQSNGEYAEFKNHFVYDNKIVIGPAVTIGTKLLYAINRHTEFGIGLDWTYMRFSYAKGWVSPAIDITKQLTEFGIFDLHVGFAFSF